MSGLLSVLLATAASAQVRGVGLRTLSLVDPVGGGGSHADVYYPGAKRKDSVLCTELGRVQITNPSLMDARVEPRVRAVLAMAPVGVFFDKAGLKDVKVPVRLYAAAEDRVLPPADHADHIRDSLPSKPEYTRVPKAGHFVFLAECEPNAVKARPQLCVDPPGVDRRKLHQQLADEAASFFRRALSAPARSP